MPNYNETNRFVAEWDENGKLTVEFIDLLDDEVGLNYAETEDQVIHAYDRCLIEHPIDARERLRRQLARSSIDAHFFGD